MLDPVAVALKFGFLAILYLFLLWMARSALKDLRRTAPDGGAPAARRLRGRDRPARRRAPAPRGTATAAARGCASRRPPGLPSGAAYDLSDGALLGRGDQADIVLEDAFASTRHARLIPQGDVIVLEDLGSTNGTYLNGESLHGAQPLHPGDRIRIGDSEFVFER